MACMASIGVASARADVSYRYVTDALTYNVGGTAGTNSSVITVFLQETVTAGSTSLIFTDGGLFAGGFMVTRTTGDGTLRIPVISGTPQPVITPNTAIGGPVPAGGFGGQTEKIDPDTGDPFVPPQFDPVAPTQLSQTPSTSTQAGLVVNADTLANAQAKNNGQTGPLVPSPGGPGVYMAKLGTFRVVLGTQATVFTVTNYGAHGDSITQLKSDLDFSDSWGDNVTQKTPYTGASTPLLGFYSFTVGGAAVPEPSSMALCGLIVSGMSYAGYRRRKNSAGEPATVA